ncbi:hypothetical protein ACOMHN_011132 [Nucella lapillus]
MKDATEEEVEEEEEEEEEVKEMAMVALGLLKQEVKVMLNQVKHLVKANPSLASQVFTTEVDGWTPVHACVLRSKKKVLKAMLQTGIDVNCRMGQPDGLPDCCALLHIAANRHDGKKIADYLLSHGADVNAKDSFGRTPLFYANRGGHRDVIKLLVDNGAVAHASPEVEVTLAPEESGVQGRKFSEDLVTPEPKLTRFCFLPLPHHHHHRHRQRQQHRRHNHQQQQHPHQHQHHRHEQSPNGVGNDHSGHRTS